MTFIVITPCTVLPVALHDVRRVLQEHSITILRSQITGHLTEEGVTTSLVCCTGAQRMRLPLGLKLISPYCLKFL